MEGSNLSAPANGTRTLLDDSTCTPPSTDKYRATLSSDLLKRHLAQRSFGSRQLLQGLRATERERIGRSSQVGRKERLSSLPSEQAIREQDSA